MLRQSCFLRSYQRGGWSPGSKHQKHMSMNPTTYLYRFAGPHGPGPFTMKYWWTLGCFPTGLETPFRLNEFLATYKQEHVPIEVEEWLSCFVKNPVEVLQQAVEDFSSAVESFPVAENSRGYTSIEPSAAVFLKPLKRFGEQLGIQVSPIGVRAALSFPKLHDRVLDDLYDYREAITESGSTPHRRLARSAFEDPLLLVEPAAGNDALARKDEISETVARSVGAAFSPPNSTAKDERKLIQLLTTFAEGCTTKKCHDDAFSLLSSSLQFAHDDETQSIVHSNMATALIMDGRFKDAEYHGRESALLGTATQRKESTARRGYALWATAVAYQDDFSRAESIVNDALTLFPESPELLELKEKVSTLHLKHAGLDYSLRGKRTHMESQQTRGILEGSGKTFDNEFDWVRFKNRLYPSKMNPTNNELGSVFRRVGDLGGTISTSRSMELL